MSAEARVRISLANGEFEVEGTEAFIAQYSDTVKQMLERLSDSVVKSLPPTNITTQDGASSNPGKEDKSAGTEMPEFGEAIHRLPRDASGTDKILVAGFYASKSNPNNAFSTAEANKLLIDQGIKVSNPSQSLKNNLIAKRAFKDGKNYKLSREGIDRVNTLLGLR